MSAADPTDAAGPTEQTAVAKPGRRWRVDRGRRERIVAAAMEILRDDGLRGLSYRRVAKAADVPLGATTYYFPAIDALLEAAFVEVISRDVDELRQRLEDMPSDGDVLGTVIEMVMARIGNRTYLVTAMELSLAALRSERLRRLSEEWDEQMGQLLLTRMDPLTARAVIAVIDGLCVQSAFGATEPSREDIDAVLRRTAAGG